jgi:DNA-binding NarL/FixJ family response regulator
MRDLDALPVLALVEEEAAAADALAHSARGVLFRDAPTPRLASALRALAHGNIVLDESLTALLRPRGGMDAPTEPLTARETEVLQLLSLGLSNKEIAGRLGMSEHTAKFHVNGILSKLGAGSRTEAVVRAARTGLLIL